MLTNDFFPLFFRSIAESICWKRDSSLERKQLRVARNRNGRIWHVEHGLCGH